MVVPEKSGNDGWNADCQETTLNTTNPITPITPINYDPSADDEALSPPRRRYVRATLAVAGSVAVAVGAAIVLVPRSFLDLDGSTSADLLSETRAPGGALVATGLFIAYAAIRRRHLAAAGLVATLLYLGYGSARVFSMAADGWPSGTIAAATIVELALGSASLLAWRSSSG